MDETKPEDSQAPVPEPTPEPTQAPMRGQISSQMPKRTKARLVAQTAVIVILILGIAGAVWYWFNVYQKPVATTNTPAPIVEEKEEIPQGNIFFLTHQAPTKEDVEQGNSSVTLFSYDGTTSAPKRISANNEKIKGEVFGTTATKLYYDNYEGFYEYDIATKQSKELVKAQPKFNFASLDLSPDKTKIVYSEICISECVDKSPNSVTNIKVYNIADRSVKTLSETSGTTETIMLVSDRWINNSLIVLTEHSEGGRLPSLKEVTLINTTSGLKTTVALDPKLYIRNVDVSPDGKSVAFTAVNIIEKGDDTYEYTAYLNIKNIESGKTETILTSNTEYTDRIFWKDNESLITTSTIEDTLSAGPGGYYAANGTYNFNLIPVNDPSKAKVLTPGPNSPKYGNTDISYFDENIVVISENHSNSEPDGVYKPNHAHYVYNFKDNTNKLITKDAVRWQFIK